jgi:hypothetical protein
LHYVVSGRPGSEHSGLWVSALRQLEESNDGTLVEYGHFFTTLNIANAYRYAICNPYRSEFIRVLAESLRVLDDVGHELPRTMVKRFPEIDRMIKNPSPPVVLELRGISRNRLLTERGDADIDGHLQSFIDMLAIPGVNAPAAFRVRNVTATDVVAVHALSDHWLSEELYEGPWRPDSSKVSAARRSARDWLAEAQEAHR